MTQDSEKSFDLKEMMERIKKDGVVILICVLLLGLSLYYAGTTQHKIEACNTYWINEIQNSGHYITIGGQQYQPKPFNLSNNFKEGNT